MTPIVDPTLKPLSPRELAAWRAYIETCFDLETAINDDLATVGLNLGDYQVLVFLSEAPDGRLRMTDLACSLQLSPSGLTRRLDGLVLNGHVSRERGASDRRVMEATLTASGRQLLERAYPVHLASVRRLLIDHVSGDDLDALTRIFTAVRGYLDGTTNDASRDDE